MGLRLHQGWERRAHSALCHCHVVDTAIQKSTESNYLKLPCDEFNANIVIINVQLWNGPNSYSALNNTIVKFCFTVTHNCVTYLTYTI